MRFLSDDERPRLIEACRQSSNRQLYPLVMLTLSTGARKMELLRLIWSQVSFERAAITLLDTKNGDRRSMPLTDPALDVVRKHSKILRFDTPLVFPRADGRQPIDIRYAWYEALKQAGIDDFNGGLSCYLV